MVSMLGAVSEAMGDCVPVVEFVAHPVYTSVAIKPIAAFESRIFTN
jgi:hypothetical protein